MLTFPEMSSSDPDKAITLHICVDRASAVFNLFFCAVTHIRRMIKHFLRSALVWQDTSHPPTPPRASHDISFCVWASVSGANLVGTRRRQAPNDLHCSPLDIQLIANVTKQPAFCPLGAQMCMFSFLRNGII